MENKLIEILESLQCPVYLQGSLVGKIEYPERFFTFWQSSSEGLKFYDNEEYESMYAYNIGFYSTDPEDTYKTLRIAKKKLRNAGFIVSGDGYSLPSQKDTHDGRGMEAYYIILKGEEAE